MAIISGKMAQGILATLDMIDVQEHQGDRRALPHDLVPLLVGEFQP